MTPPSTYTYGDDEAAARRLGLVAEAYAPRSRVFVAGQLPRARAGAALTVLDVGCGPGFSTALLEELVAPRRLVGIDSSPAFLDRARARVPRAEFVLHDVTRQPLPGSPADVVYARLVLSHVPDPLGAVMAWVGQLAPRGVVLVEDLEEIVAPAGALREYEAVAASVVRAGGGTLYAGPALAGAGGRCVAVTVPGSLAAVVYLVNVRRWLADPPTAVEPGRLRDLEVRLEALAGGEPGPSVSWIVRQVAVRA